MAHYTFLDFPGEIRNQIYIQLLVIPTVATHRLSHSRRVSIHPEILRACRQVYKEAKAILYGCNTFVAHQSLLSTFPRINPPSAKLYPCISSPALISLIRKFIIRIRLDCDPNFTYQQATKAFTGIEELTIEVFQSSFGSSDNSVLKLFAGVRGVKSVQIYGSVTHFPEYVEWLQKSMMAAEGDHVEEFEEEKVFSGMARMLGVPSVWGVSA